MQRLGRDFCVKDFLLFLQGKTGEARVNPLHYFLALADRKTLEIRVSKDFFDAAGVSMATGSDCIVIDMPYTVIIHNADRTP